MTSLIIFCAQYLIFIEIAILAVYFFLLSKNYKQSILLLSVVYLPLVYIVAKIFSWVYFNPRPFVVGNFTPLVAHAATNGFPSEHMLLASAMASIIFIYNKKFGLIVWLIALAIGAARVLAGVHHWLDIWGSVIITIVVMLLVKKFIIPYLEKLRKRS